MSDSKIITFSFCDNFLDRFIDFLDQEYIRKGIPLDRLAIVSGGKRPALFIKRALAKKLKKSFFPPRFFTMDDWMKSIVLQKEALTGMQDLEQCYLIYQLAQEVAVGVLKGRESFSAFLPWAREILRFIDQLDLERVDNKKLKNVEENAQIGYAVPEDINRLLESIVKIRQAYHDRMKSRGQASRGYFYMRAAELVENADFSEFEHVLFINLFYLNRSEQRVVQDLYQKNKATFFFQGDQRRWPVFQRIAKNLSESISEGDELQKPQFDLKLYSAFDTHSQVCLVREILQKVKDPARTLIVLPEPRHIIPLISEMSAVSDDYNVSMGYPLKRSPLCALLELIFRAQLSRNDAGEYYTRDYLRVLRHPLVKNMSLTGTPVATRILIHKIEDILSGQAKADLSGRVMLDLDVILEEPQILDLTIDTLGEEKGEVSSEQLKDLMSHIHQWVFRDWEQVNTFSRQSEVLQSFCRGLADHSPLEKYPLNLKIIARLFSLIDELGAVSFSKEVFPQEELFSILQAKIDKEIVAFEGSPLKGLQILGLFETRALNFDEVIVMDVNEGLLPHLNIYEPLIPRDVMIGLNLDRLEQEEEIQRYQFMRLLSAAKTVHLVYEESRDKARSRFVEELVWEHQKDRSSLEPPATCRPSFNVEVAAQHLEVVKTPQMIEKLKKHRFSASSINTYLWSPIEFYYQYVLGLREREDLLEEPENRQVGTFVHQVLEEAFKGFVGKTPVIDKAFQAHFKKLVDRHFDETLGRSMRSDAFLLKSVLDMRLHRFIEHEATSPDRRVQEIVSVEQSYYERIALSCGELEFVYKLDRVDRLHDGTLMVIDYKTGSVDPMPKDISRIETMDLSRESIFEHLHSFQIPLYFFYLVKHHPDQRINAALYNLRTLELKKLIDQKMQAPLEQIELAFMRALDYIMCEILNPDVPFRDS